MWCSDVLQLLGRLKCLGLPKAERPLIIAQKKAADRLAGKKKTIFLPAVFKNQFKNS